MEILYIGRVETDGGMLNMRDATDGAVMDRLECGEEVSVTADCGRWLEIARGENVGYVAKEYVGFVQAKQEARLVITDEAGHAFTPEGGVTVKLAAGPVD